MSRYCVGRIGMSVLAVMGLLFTASDLSAQFQPAGTLGVLAPANIAKPRPKPPFDITGTWLHSRTDPERFEAPAGAKFTPYGQKHFDAAAAANAAGKIYRNDIGLCWPAGVPIMMTRVWPIQMIQLPTSIFMISELMNSLRIVYMDGRKHTDPDIVVRSFNGESIGHWETNTLVIDTTNFVDEHHWIQDRTGVPGSDALRVIERIQMQSEGKRLEIEYTITDPKVFIGEWKFVKHWDRVDDRDIAEVECLPDLNDHMPSVHSSDNVRQ